MVFVAIWGSPAKPHLLAAQETHLKLAGQVQGAHRWLRARNFRAAGGLSLSTGDQATASEAGVLAAVAVQASSVAVSPKALGVPAEFGPRLQCTKVQMMCTKGLLFFSFYGFVREDRKYATWEALEHLRVFLLRCGQPWVIADDFNLASSDLRLARWAHLLRATVVAPAGPT